MFLIFLTFVAGSLVLLIALVFVLARVQVIFDRPARLITRRRIGRARGLGQ